MPSVLAGNLQNQKGAELKSLPMQFGAFARAEEEMSPEKVDLGELAEGLTDELTSTVALSMPVVVTGVTLIAHGAIASSDLCFFLGIACVVFVVAFHLWTRQKVRSQIVQLAVERGLSEREAHRRASGYLSSWLS